MVYSAKVVVQAMNPEGPNVKEIEMFSEKGMGKNCSLMYLSPDVLQVFSPIKFLNKCREILC